MHHFHVPCGQQDSQQVVSHHQPRSFQSSFKRSSSQYSKNAQVASGQPNVSSETADGTGFQSHEYGSSTSPPSLGSSSPSSHEDATSPQTPSPQNTVVGSNPRIIKERESIADLSTIRRVAAWQKQHNTNRVASVRIPQALPCRSKHGDSQTFYIAEQYAQQYDVAPPIIQETVKRSRVAREPTKDALHLQQDFYGAAGAAPPAVVTSNSRCHTRRRPCVEARSVAPPKLKRDTECTDSIVRLIVCLSTKLVHAIWSQSAVTPKTSSGFNGAGVLPLKVFIQETLRRSKTSYSTLQVALFYLIQLKPHVQSYHNTQEQGVPLCRALQCGRRMFLTALILASKYLQDRNYSSRAWSKISGLPVAEINENERRYLNLIQFNLHMKKDAFENWSKITLTLCKVGEASMVESASVISDSTAAGSDSWWSYQLRRLTSELVQDSKQTDDYLASLTINNTSNSVSSEELTASLDTPPSSPESVGEAVTENNLMKMLAETNSESLINHKFADFSSSPASVQSLPSRPNPPNLPTPSTTPRYGHVLPWPKGSCQPSIRCQASSQALLSLDKQGMNVANLDTCPPPKPRPCDLPRSATYPSKRAPSSLGTTMVATSLTCSPESMMSDASSGITRSRSSSISSNSSVWFASGKYSLTDNVITQCPLVAPKGSKPVATTSVIIPASYSFYHSNDVTLTQFEDEGVAINSCASQTVQPSQPISQRTAKFLDEGYGSDGRSEIDKILIEQRVAETLASMCTRGGRTSCPAEVMERSPYVRPTEVQQRRHKRSHSSITDPSLHNNIRHLMWSNQPEIEVVETRSFPQSKVVEVKQLQYPEKEWADVKKPAPNNMYNKRVALQCQTEGPCNEASNLAARYLRDATMIG